LLAFCTVDGPAGRRVGLKPLAKRMPSPALGLPPRCVEDIARLLRPRVAEMALIA